EAPGANAERVRDTRAPRVPGARRCRRSLGALASSRWSMWSTAWGPRSWPKRIACSYPSNAGWYQRAGGQTMMAAIYARVSSARQKEEQTIASQTAALQAHAQAAGPQ